MDKVEKAVNYFKNGHLCSQSVFVSFCEELGFDKETGFKISKFLGNGYLYRADICGAISGALMIYSLKFSSGEKIDELSDEISYQLSKDHMEAFKKANGSCICKELLENDLSTFEGLEKIREKGYFETKCPLFIEESAKLLYQALEKMKSKNTNSENI